MTGELLLSILGIALVAAAAIFALLPFATRVSEVGAGTLEGTLVARQALYRQVLELEFDHAMGKLSAGDFEALSRQLLAQAGESLRDERGSLGAIDAEIEREIAAARAAFAAARRTRQTAEAETTVS